jgi:hypothetical protein
VPAFVETSLIRHPNVGELRLHREKLAVVGSEGLQLVIYHAEPGSPAADRLTRLSTLAAFNDQDVKEHEQG